MLRVLTMMADRAMLTQLVHTTVLCCMCIAHQIQQGPCGDCVSLSPLSLSHYTYHYVYACQHQAYLVDELLLGHVQGVHRRRLQTLKPCDGVACLPRLFVHVVQRLLPRRPPRDIGVAARRAAAPPPSSTTLAQPLLRRVLLLLRRERRGERAAHGQGQGEDGVGGARGQRGHPRQAASAHSERTGVAGERAAVKAGERCRVAGSRAEVSGGVVGARQVVLRGWCGCTSRELVGRGREYRPYVSTAV